MTSGLKLVLQIVSYVGLALSFFPAMMVNYGSVSTETYSNLLLLGMVLWFGTAIFWVKPEQLGE